METARCKAFLAAAEHGSISGAAKELGYSAPGVSQLVAALEDELGFKLFERTKKGVLLTKDGDRMLPLIKRLIAEEEAVYEMASDIRGLAVGSVTVCSYPSIATYLLPEVIRCFRKDYPNIQIKLMEGIQQEIREWIESGEADIGFQACPDSSEYEYEWIPLREDRMVAVVPDEHPLAKDECYPISRCVEEDFIMPALGNDEDVVGLLEKYDIEPKICFTTMENPVMLGMIKSGLGMSIMNELCTEVWKDRLNILSLDPPSFVTFGVVSVKGRHLSPSALKFREYSIKMLTKADSYHEN